MTPETYDLIDLRLHQSADCVAEGGIAERFHREFVASGLFPKEVAEHFKRATDLHHGLDSHSQSPPDADRLKQLLTDAETFLTATKLFLGK